MHPYRFVNVCTFRQRSFAFQLFSWQVIREIICSSKGVVLSNENESFSQPKWCWTSDHNSLSLGSRTFRSIKNPVPNLSLMCQELPMHLNLPPLTIIPIFVLNASASSMLCVVRTTALDFFYAILATTDHMNFRASGSIPADGSSSKIIGGLPTNAFATQTFL